MKKFKYRGICCLFGIALVCAGPFSCSEVNFSEQERSDVTLFFETGTLTKSADPDEDLVKDLNLFIFNEKGLLEDREYISERMLGTVDGKKAATIKLIKGAKYSIYVCANLGFGIDNVSSLNELMEFRCYMAYPDAFSRGIPMRGVHEDFVAGDSLTVTLERMMAKISLSVDRSALDSGISYTVKDVQIHGSPRSVLVFGNSKAQNEDDSFLDGYRKTLSQLSNLNKEVADGVSGEVNFYMLESMNGETVSDQCPYIEIKAEYVSSTWHTKPGEYLIYRVRLGESAGNYDIERNSCYHITIKPEGTGLTGSGWQIDKDGLTTFSTGSIKIEPEGIISGNIGDKVHLRAIVTPESAPFSIGLEELEYDKGRGIYDYEIDEDGRGVTLTLTGSGTGIIYMEAGEPVNDAAMAIVVVNLPQT